MFSITKNRQDAATLRRMIERAYGPEQVPVGDDFAHEFTHGWFNAAYWIDLRDGTAVALKIAPPAGVAVLTREQNMMRAELEAMRLAHEHTSVPVPRIDYADLTHELIDADYFFMEFIDADNFGIAADAGELSPDEIVAGYRHLGELNRELNSVVGPHCRRHRSGLGSGRDPRDRRRTRRRARRGHGAAADRGRPVGHELDDPRRQDRLDPRPRARHLRRPAHGGGVDRPRHAGLVAGRAVRRRLRRRGTHREPGHPSPVALLCTGLGFAFLDPLLILACSILSTGFSAIVRAEGRLAYSMLLWVVPVIVQIVLDPLFIFGLGMGTAGAALGTVGGQGVSAALAAYAVVSRVSTFVMTPQIGLTQAIQPIVGYNAGAGADDRVSRTLRLGLGASLGYGVAVTAGILIFAEPLVGAAALLLAARHRARTPASAPGAAPR